MLPNGLADLVHSERGTYCLLALLCVTVLAALKILTAEQWIGFVTLLTGALVTSKTITTAVETVATKKPQIPNAQPKPEAP